MAKSKKKISSSSKPVSTNQINFLLFNGASLDESSSQNIIEQIQSAYNNINIIKWIGNDSNEKNIPQKIFESSRQTIENDFLKNTIIAVDLDKTTWFYELTELPRAKSVLAGSEPLNVVLLDQKGKTNRQTATSILPKQYISNHTRHEGLSYGQLITEIRQYNYSSSLAQSQLFLDKPSDLDLPVNSPLQSLKNIYDIWIRNPWSEYKDPEATPLSKKQATYKLMLVGLLILGLLYALIGGVQAGISSDEHRYLGQAEKAFNFYKSFGADTSVNTKSGVDPQYFNGQIFDNLVYTIGKPFGLERNFTYRHLLIGMVGWFALLFSCLIALRIGGYRAALFTTLLMLLSPIFMGNVFNNHRDIPLATFTIFGIYAIIRFWEFNPVVSRKYLAYVIVALALSFASRLAGGVLLTALMGLYSLLYLIQSKSFSKIFSLDKSYLKPVWMLAIGVVVAFVLNLIVWPYGLVAPLAHSLEVIKSSGNHPVALYQTFEAQYRLSSSMPDYYVIKYIFITLPLSIFIGLALLLYFYFRKKTGLDKSIIFLLIFAFAFPLIYSYFELGNMYGSWRHFLFTFPFIAICAALGWHTLLNHIPKLKNSLWSVGILALTLIHPLQHILRNHPFEYLYYNELVGGTGGAYGNYELDYSLNSLKQGSEWLKDYIRKNHPKGTKLVVASNGGSELTQYFKGFDDSVSTIYTRYYERGTQLWDYAIFPNMYIHPFQLKNNIFPSGDSLHTIKIDGKPLCFIYKRRSTEDYQAVQALNKGDANLAVQKFQAYLKHNPKSEWAWFQLAYIFAQNSNWAQAQTYVTESFKFHPEFLPSRALQGLIYINTNRLKDAQPIFDKLIEDKYDLVNSYKWSGMTYENEKNYRKALQQYGFALGAGNQQKDTYAKIANCFRQLGDVNQAQKYEAMAQ